jgi:DNA-binding beta-propeller fold protein YncE
MHVLTSLSKLHKTFLLALAAVVGSQPLALAQTPAPYALQGRNKIGGNGGFDYVYADVTGRRLYIPRPGSSSARITVFNLDTLEATGVIPNVNARGVAVDPASHHGFASSKPVTMWDTQTLSLIKAIDVQGRPDGILFDPYNGRIWVFSHAAPNATVIEAKDGTLVGTLELGGEPEQAVTDGAGRIFVDLENKDEIAVVDAKSLSVMGTYGLGGKGGGPGGLAFDARNRILFATCHKPATMVILGADNGNILAALPIGNGTDGALFNPQTFEAFSSNGAAGTLSVIKELSPTEFTVEQTVPTMIGARTSTLDSKTNRVLLIGAEFGPAPSPATPGGWSRGPMLSGSFSILVVGR